jgi:hypothetical protein
LTFGEGFDGSYNRLAEFMFRFAHGLGDGILFMVLRDLGFGLVLSDGPIEGFGVALSVVLCVGLSVVLTAGIGLFIGSRIFGL